MRLRVAPAPLRAGFSAGAALWAPATRGPRACVAAAGALTAPRLALCAAGNVDEADGASLHAKLRRAAETFARTPSLFKVRACALLRGANRGAGGPSIASADATGVAKQKRKPMPQPLETHGSGLDLLALAQARGAAARIAAQSAMLTRARCAAPAGG